MRVRWGFLVIRIDGCQHHGAFANEGVWSSGMTSASHKSATESTLPLSQQKVPGSNPVSSNTFLNFLTSHDTILSSADLDAFGNLHRFSLSVARSGCAHHSSGSRASASARAGGRLAHQSGHVDPRWRRDCPIQTTLRRHRCHRPARRMHAHTPLPGISKGLPAMSEPSQVAFARRKQELASKRGFVSLRIIMSQTAYAYVT